MFNPKAWMQNPLFVKYSSKTYFQYVLPAVCLLSDNDDIKLLWVHSRARYMGVAEAFLEKLSQNCELQVTDILPT